MFGWFRSSPPKIHVFTNPREAFAHACDNLPNLVLLEAVIPALVEESGGIGRDGEHRFCLRLAAAGGGREVWAGTLKEATDYPEIGDLVGFRVVRIASELPEDASIIGYIAYKFEPVLVEKKGWKIAKNYTPDNIKPVLRL